MPIYEYHCDHCGSDFEVMQRVSEPPVETCERCGAGPVHKLISQSSFILKGSGWYVTDYGRGKTHAKEAHKEKDQTKSSSSTTKGESKPKASSGSEGDKA